MDTASHPSQNSKRSTFFKHALILMIIGAVSYLCLFMMAIHIIGTIDRTEEADSIIVLGAGLRRDGRPGWALTRRAEMAADLWHQGIAPYVLCTGAQADGYPRSEASACQEILLREGVDESAILLEDNSHSTEENAIYSSSILNERGLSSVVLVSDSYHMLRAEWLFRSEGITAYTSPVSASRINYPLSYPLSLFREFTAFHWYVFKDLFNIPITHIYGV